MSEYFLCCVGIAFDESNYTDQTRKETRTRGEKKWIETRNGKSESLEKKRRKMILLFLFRALLLKLA